MIHIGETIRMEVRRQGITNEEFAERICVTPRTVNKLFNKTSIDTHRLFIVCKVLGVDLFALYSEMLADKCQHIVEQ